MNVFTHTHRFSARLLAILAVFSLLMSLVPVQVFAENETPEAAPAVEQQLVTEQRRSIEKRPEVPMLKICHANRNGFDNGKKEVAESSILGGEAHGNHNTGGYQNVGDIIPPFGDYVGKNWTEPFISIYNNDCKADSKIAVKNTL